METAVDCLDKDRDREALVMLDIGLPLARL